MSVKIVKIFKDIKLENFNSIETFFFRFTKLNISFLPKRGLIPKKQQFFGGLDTLKNNIGRTKISRWLGRENEENLARNRNCCGWPTSPP